MKKQRTVIGWVPSYEKLAETITMFAGGDEPYKSKLACLDEHQDCKPQKVKLTESITAEIIRTK